MLATLLPALAVLLFLIPVVSAGQPGAGAPPPAGRLAQPRGEEGCIHARGVNRCARGRAVSSPEELAVSPDGRHVYVASLGSHAVAGFARDRRTGELDQLRGQRGCVRLGRSRSCTPARALARPVSLAISPDGASVYVAKRGGTVVTMVGTSRLFENGAVAIRADRIVAVGPA